MPHRRRLAFVLRNVQGLEVADVAQALDISESTAKREISRAKEVIRVRSRGEPALGNICKASREAAMPESFPDNAALTKLPSSPANSQPRRCQPKCMRKDAIASWRWPFRGSFHEKRCLRPPRWHVRIRRSAAFAVVFWSTTRVRPITYEIAGGSRFESGYLSASPDRAAVIRFPMVPR